MFFDPVLFYSYTVPQSARDRAAGHSSIGCPRCGIRSFSEFILMYDERRRAESPEQALYEFLESTYEAGATLGGWDRKALEEE